MLVPAEMSEVDIFALDSDVQAIAETIARMSVMHLLDVNTLGDWAADAGTEWSGRVSRYATQARRVRDLFRALRVDDGTSPYDGPLDAAGDSGIIEERLQDIEGRVHALRDQEHRLRRELERLELTSRSMELLAPLSVSLEELRQLRYLHLVVGTIPSENLPRLEASLARVPYTIMPVHRYDGRVLIFAFCSHEQAAILDRALESAFLDQLEIPEEFTGTAQQALVQVSERIQEARRELDGVRAQSEDIVQRTLPEMRQLLTRILGDQAIAEAMAHFGRRGRLYLIAGWVPTTDVAALRAAVEEISSGRATFEENSPYAPGAGHPVPTLLRNGKLLRPLEQLVTIYGIPGYRELDPTPALTITFLLMFGMMFGDLGHGLVLATVGLLAALRVVRPLARFASLGTILAACGLSSAAFGLLYGSLFGQEGVIPTLWLRPLDDIFGLLAASVGFGVVVLNVGFAFHLVTAARRGRFRTVIVDRDGIVGILLYWTLLATVLLVATGRSVPAILPGLAVLLAAALFFAAPITNLLTGHRPLIEGNGTEWFVQAFFELFESFISYLSNTLSYVRLGAFAVAHVGLTTVVVLLADMLGGAAGGGLNAVLRVMVLVLGNLFVIGFEGLIVGIQTLRLEYYEFFGKFFTGEGVPFRPLSFPAASVPRTPAR